MTQLDTSALPGLEGNTRNKEEFLNELILQLAATLQNVVGLDEAEGFVKMVGLQIGDAIGVDYERGAEDAWNIEYLAAVLVDLKTKIDGGFSIERFDPDKIILVNNRCPFGPAVEGRPALCQMTSSVFGRIAARHFEHANVEITEAIARGDGRCRVIVRLDPDELTTRGGVDFYRAE